MRRLIKAGLKLAAFSPEVKNPMDRIMYHLFASLGFAARYDGAALFDESTFVGALFRALAKCGRPGGGVVWVLCWCKARAWAASL